MHLLGTKLVDITNANSRWDDHFLRVPVGERPLNPTLRMPLVAPKCPPSIVDT